MHNRQRAEKMIDQFNLFGNMVFFIGGGAIIAAMYFQSMIPIGIVSAGLFCILSFMNGLT